ncbi:hypothetical protein JYU34_017346 [Plutella xylostella]|uniref:Chorein N-terminal domain-containing protein n=1 Tax=Plutella xylostella TaxID=51655 RepID=A0ABQ7Q0Y8_PLUXY|nr:hypothetical protein JYU34_017346 [Plutella xylostella]
MFEGVVAGFLNRLLGKYVEDLNTEDLNVGIFSGSVLLTDLKLKPEALFELDLPIDVKIGTVGRISIQIPWSSLQRAPVSVVVEDVLLLVAPSVSNTGFDREREKRLCRARGRRRLRAPADDAEILSGPEDIVESLYTAMVNNLQVYIRNVHIRYEDTVSSRDGPLACGLCLQSLSIETTNSKWKPSVSTAGTSPIYQLVRITALSVYWACGASTLDEQQVTNISPVQYYNWKHYMLSVLRADPAPATVVDPFSCKIKVILNRSGEPRVPKLLVDALVQDFNFHLSRRQYLSMDNLISSIKRMDINRQYRHLHPGVPLTQSVKKWWLYAYNAVLEQRVRPYTWRAIKTHRQNYLKYKQTYMSVLNSPHDTELKLDLQQCQDCLPVISVLIAREHAKIQLHAKESSLVEIQESDSDWWKPWTDKSSDGEESKAQIIAKNEKQKSLWSHLSSPEKKKVCELIGYVEGTPRQDKPKQYIEHKINLTLANSSITLLNRDKEIFALTLTQFLVSLETRPSAKSYKLSCRAESIVAEGLGPDDALIPLLLPAKLTSPSTSVNFLSLDFERNPVNNEADYGVQLLVEPADFCYNEHAIQELINLFQIRPSWSPVALGGALRRGARAAARALHLHAQVKGASVALHQGHDKPGRIIVLDIDRVLIKSDLQPSNLALEDATCMELEEKLYDRLHAECTFQILFCDSSDPWREARKSADSELHLVPKTKIQVVFSNSTKKDYKLLPRYKLNVSITSLKLNLSDRIIGLLLDFLDNLPIPVPNTVAVSFLDSGDFMDDLEDPELVERLKMDRIQPDPSCKELTRLRQKIVAAYLGRTRASEQPIDKELAKESFQAATSAVFVSTEHSDSEMEVYARSIDLPGFDDNVSPSNHIDMLMRFVVGEIQINLARSSEDSDRAYMQLRVEHTSVECADMTFGPALQFSAARVSLFDASHQLMLLDTQEHCLHMLYRKVRADCPDFRSHFHSVEQSLVLDLGDISLELHSGALHTMLKYLQYIYDKIQQRHAIYPKKIVSKARDLWNEVMKPELDPPVPTGATKFSYSFRASQLKAHITLDAWSLTTRIGGVQSELIFRANDRMLFKLFVMALHADVQDEPTLYPALMWPDEDKVLEMKLVLAAPRLYGSQREKADGELRLHVGRMHVVVFHSVLSRLQQFLDPLIPPSMAYEAMQSVEQHFQKHLQVFRTSQARLNLVIEIHAPILLLPQKPSSPTLLVLNMGDLQIENFFKRVKTTGSPSSAPVVDNILVKWTEITLSRAIMTLAGTLELQAPILEPISARCDLKRYIGGGGGGGSLWLDAAASVDCVSANLAQLDLAALYCITSTSSIRELEKRGEEC